MTDAIKRALRNFGNLLGNCLYDKQYTQEIVKIKVQPPKFDRSALHRRPEFEEGSTSKAGMATGRNACESAKSTRESSNAVKSEKSAKSMPPPPLPRQCDGTDPRVQVKPEANCHPSVHPRTCAISAPQDPRAQVSAQEQSSVPLPVQRQNRPAAAQSHSVDADETPYFNSEDDALFMQVDMDGIENGCAEEDRPIHPEADNDGEADTTVSTVLTFPVQQYNSSTRSICDTNDDALHAPPSIDAGRELKSHHPPTNQNQTEPPLQRHQPRPAHPDQAIPQQLRTARSVPVSSRQRPSYLIPKHVQGSGTPMSRSPSSTTGGLHVPPGKVSRNSLSIRISFIRSNMANASYRFLIHSSTPHPTYILNLYIIGPALTHSFQPFWDIRRIL